MIGPSNVSARDLPDPDGSRFGVPTFSWNTAPKDLGQTVRQLEARGLRPGDKTDIAGQILRPRRRREPLAAYLYRVEDALPKRPATEAELAALARGRRTQQEQAMIRRGIDPHEEIEQADGWHAGEDETETEELELEEW